MVDDPSAKAQGVERETARADHITPVETPRSELVAQLDQLLLHLPQDKAQDLRISINSSHSEVASLIRERSAAGIRSASTPEPTITATELDPGPAGVCAPEGEQARDVPSAGAASLLRAKAAEEAKLPTDVGTSGSDETREDPSSPEVPVMNSGEEGKQQEKGLRVPPLALDHAVLPADSTPGARESWRKVGVELWDVSDVKSFLEGLGFRDVAACAECREVDGMTLLLMGDGAFAEMGVSSAVDCAKIRAEAFRMQKAYTQIKVERRSTRYGAACAVCFGVFAIILLVPVFLTLARVS